MKRIFLHLIAKHPKPYQVNVSDNDDDHNVDDHPDNDGNITKSQKPSASVCDSNVDANTESIPHQMIWKDP